MLLCGSLQLFLRVRWLSLLLGWVPCRDEVNMLEQATSLLGALVKYVDTNSVADWREQADMAKELSSLLQEKLNLVRRFNDL